MEYKNPSIKSEKNASKRLIKIKTNPNTFSFGPVKLLKSFKCLIAFIMLTINIIKSKRYVKGKRDKS